MRIGYIVRYGKDSDVRFKYREDSYTRKITSRGDRVYCKMLYPQDYDDVQSNTEIIREKGLILVQEPFFVDDEIREKVIRWIEWANNENTKPSDYDLFESEANV